MSLLKVFVYGTLKPGYSNYQRYCAGKIIEAEPATAKGQLFELPVGYPAMIPGDEWIQGFVLTFNDPAVLKDLDRLEDYDLNRPATQNEYHRQKIEVFKLDGTSLGQIWAYLMSQEQIEQRNGKLIVSGCWQDEKQIADLSF